MYAITGITGHVGGVVAKALLDSGRQVRAVVRYAKKGDVWATQGCEVAVADMADAKSLSAAMTGVEGVFVLIPPIFDPTPGFAEIKAIIAALTEAIAVATPPKIVSLSTIGAQATKPSLLNQLGLVEQALSGVATPVCFLRAAWFMENAAWDVPAAREGVIPYFLQPLEKPVPMVATADIGRLAAALLRENWSGRRIVELEGPRRVSPNDVAAAFARILNRPVRVEAVPRDHWEEIFASQGMKNPGPRAQMIDGFNQGWIEFEQGENAAIKGSTELSTVLTQLVTKP
jgi:NAD(P)H dehydrogenase (quinone)